MYYNPASADFFVKHLYEINVEKNERNVLFAMMFFRNNERNDCYASQETIAKKAGYKDTTAVKRAIASLKRKGIIEVLPPKRLSHNSESQNYSKYNSNTYFFTFLKDNWEQSRTYHKGQNAMSNSGEKTTQTKNPSNNYGLSNNYQKRCKTKRNSNLGFDLDEFFDLAIQRGNEKYEELNDSAQPEISDHG